MNGTVGLRYLRANGYQFNLAIFFCASPNHQGEVFARGCSLLHIFVDADACPVKQEVYRVAKRYDLSVTLVAGSWMRVPEENNLSLKVVGKGMDAADDWIVEHLGVDDIVITADIPLAARCLEKAAYALGPTGKPWVCPNLSKRFLGEIATYLSFSPCEQGQ